MPSITPSGSQLIFKNNIITLQIDLCTARSTSIKVLTSNVELVDQGYLETFVKYWEYPPTEGPNKNNAPERHPDSLAYCASDAQSGVLKAFFPSGVELSMNCRAEAAHFFFDLSQIDGPEVEIAKIGVVLFGAVALRGECFGDLIAAVENAGLVVAPLPLNLSTSALGAKWGINTPIYTIGSQCYRVKEAGWGEFHLVGAQMALLTCPKANCLEHMESIVDQYNLPKPKHNGVWHKKHPDIHRSYLFVDITGQNFNAIIDLAKLGKFGHIMPYVGIWSKTFGSYNYEDNPNFPPPNTLLKVVNQIHGNGLKFGLHHMSLLLEDNDSYVQNNDGSAINVSGHWMADIHSDLPGKIAERLKTICQHLGVDLLFLDGTDLIDRQFPALIHSTAQWYAAPFTVEKLAEALDGKIILQSSAGVTYLWYRTTRGSAGDYVAIGVEPHLDFDRIGFRWNKRYRSSCMLMELGWFGFFAKLNCYKNGIGESNKTNGEIYNKSYAATTLDEIEYLLNRSLGYNLPFSIESHYDQLTANGHTQQAFKLIGKYEHLRLNGDIPIGLREKLQHPDMPFITQYGLLKEQYRLAAPSFSRLYRQAYFEKVLHDGEHWDFVNPFHAQPLQVKITALPGVAPPQDDDNIELLDKAALNQFEAMNNDSTKEYPVGNTLVLFNYDKATGNITANYQAPEFLSEFAWCSLGHDLNGINLTYHKVIFVDLEGDGNGAVLNIQLADDKGNLRVYQIVLEAGLSIRRQFVLYQPTTTDFYQYPPYFGGMLNFKYFDFSSVQKLSLYIKNICRGAGHKVNITLHAIKALQQDMDTTVKNAVLTLNQKTLKFPYELHPEKLDYGPNDRRNREPWEYAELSGFFLRKYDDNHQPLSIPMPVLPWNHPTVKSGANTLIYQGKNGGLARVRIVVEDSGMAL